MRQEDSSKQWSNTKNTWNNQSASERMELSSSPTQRIHQYSGYSLGQYTNALTNIAHNTPTVTGTILSSNSSQSGEESLEDPLIYQSPTSTDTSVTEMNTESTGGHWTLMNTPSSTQSDHMSHQRTGT